MRESEAAVWERFLRQLPWPALDIEYDVRLGEGTVLPPETPEWVQRMAYQLSTKRVDAVVTTSERIYLVEVKDRISFSALGQLLGYRSLFMAERRPTRTVSMVVVGEILAPDVAGVLSEHGIEVFLV